MDEKEEWESLFYQLPRADRSQIKLRAMARIRAKQKPAMPSRRIWTYVDPIHHPRIIGCRRVANVIPQPARRTDDFLRPTHSLTSGDNFLITVSIGLGVAATFSAATTQLITPMPFLIQVVTYQIASSLIVGLAIGSFVWRRIRRPPVTMDNDNQVLRNYKLIGLGGLGVGLSIISWTAAYLLQTMPIIALPFLLVAMFFLVGGSWLAAFALGRGGLSTFLADRGT